MSRPSAERTSDSISTSPPVGRLAPSPTGLLHLGHARSFLLAWCHTRSRGGRVLLRFDDLDTTRARPEFEEAALRDLAWLGLDWDGAVTRQSQQSERFAAALRTLSEHGLCYPCVCSRRDVQEAIAAPHQGQAEVRYPGTCKGRFHSLAQAQAETGRPASLRFVVPEAPVHFSDLLCGPRSVDVAGQVGDFVVARRDGSAAYQLAVVVDDAAQGVTEVVRGLDLLDSTARQWLLQRALGLQQPNWAHLPLVLDDSGHRLAKRSDALSLQFLRESGVDPRAIVAWGARSAGLDAPDHCTAQELLKDFDLTRMDRRPVIWRAEQQARFPSTPQNEG